MRLLLCFFTDQLSAPPRTTKSFSSPICNRCHDLIHHNVGVPVIHPTLQSIREIISESPWTYNHVYHILDAADFPLSIIPQIQRQLSLSPQRSHNRRAKTSNYHRGRRADLSFIITRSDLLAPKKEQVDGLMPYLVQVLRDALGPSAENVRLGNVRCVSSKRGWWTKDLKEDIRNRGGGGWMVGRVNVGKSNLFECVFPKGCNDAKLSKSKETIHGMASDISSGNFKSFDDCEHTGLRQNVKQSNDLQKNLLLPPAPMEIPYPMMPVVSSLAGTTASPIRLPFGNGKGELIDLPGLHRSTLEDYVDDDHKLDLVMRKRLKPDQYVIKSGQSLLLGGLIRITPETPDVTVLAYPFVPMKSHIISTEKAVDVNSHQRYSEIPTILKSGVGESLLSAGTFYLKWDVTKQRSGPLTSLSAMGLSVQALPFTIMSADILIEGCGWVELTAQVRKRIGNENSSNKDGFPAVEVFSPEGKHIGVRRPMNAWLLGGKRIARARGKNVRRCQSIKEIKKKTFLHP